VSKPLGECPANEQAKRILMLKIVLRPFQGRCHWGKVPGASPPATDRGACGAVPATDRGACGAVPATDRAASGAVPATDRGACGAVPASDRGALGAALRRVNRLGDAASPGRALVAVADFI